MLCENIGLSGEHLTFAGRDVTELTEKYGTPLYLMDEGKIRSNCRTYKKAMAEHFGEGSFPVFASKAACFKRIYEIMKEENMGIDLVSPGEIATAVKAGFPMENSYFHGNNKTDSDINFAMDKGVGYFMVDNMCELKAINAFASERGIVQKVILRLTPGIDPHTYAAVATGKVDSKFGIAIETNQAEEFVKEAKDFGSVQIAGYHCHVGSQVFNEEGNVYLDAATIMLKFFADMYHKYNVRKEKNFH